MLLANNMYLLTNRMGLYRTMVPLIFIGARLFSHRTPVYSNKFLYDILGVDPNCKKSNLKKAYHECCKKYHPDLNKDTHAKFLEAQRAYFLLNNKDEKIKYDSMKGKDLEVFTRNWKREFTTNKLDKLTVSSVLASCINKFSYFKNRRELKLAVEDNKYENTNFLYFILDGSSSMKLVPTAELNQKNISRTFISNKIIDGTKTENCNFDPKLTEILDSCRYISKCLNSISFY